MAQYDDDFSMFFRLPVLRNVLNDIKRVDGRRKKFCQILEVWQNTRENEADDQMILDLMNCKKLFPSVEYKHYFLRYALEQRSFEMVKLIEASGLDIREVVFEDGQSAVHYLAEVVYGINDIFLLAPKVTTLELMEYFLNDTKTNYQDRLGYTYFHAACMSGNVTAVNLFLSQDVDVNLDSYEYSALHIAAQYRHEEIVEILLRHGADANKQDAEKSTPLHALARPCLCSCTNAIAFCDRRKPADKIVQMLVDHGAILETRNRDGNSPLDLAVSRFDVQLVKSFLKHGASLDDLNEDRMFGAEFTVTELKNYPLTLNIIETVQLLLSTEYRMSLHTTFKMIKCFETVRGDDTDHLVPELTGMSDDLIFAYSIKNMLLFHRHFGLYIRQEAYDLLDERCNGLKKEVEDFERRHDEEVEVREEVRKTLNVLSEKLGKMDKITITEDISLYQLCQMNYSKGYSVIKKLNNWQPPPLDNDSCTHLNIIVRRHVGNILIRRHLELFVADLFMTDYCKLNLPYVVCRLVAEKMSYEELLRLFHQTDEDRLS